ncbi:amidohydrolase family protein [Longispora sp. NPDC051575]|uniref:N-acyl-D-amino-acid deacylase family protein n=1 Tax=Longispora sp. NPDC051575 TaxID=3154943 RepID=UPI003424D4D1
MIDLLLRGGTVHDGLGSPAVTADVAVTGDTVTAVGTDLGPARRTVDVTGLLVTPGFLDPHAHSDMVPLMADPQPFKLRQGVTTEIVGNCGYSFAPLSADAAREASVLFADISAGVPVRARTFAEYLVAVADAGPTNHVAALVGHNTLRLTANGMVRNLRPGAAGHMARLAAEAFEAGAIGLSSGLIYPPGCYADTAELTALARVAHRWNLPYATHLRNEDNELLAAVDEAVTIARDARVRLQVSHCKIAGRPNHGTAGALLDRLRAARAAGVDVRGDLYPYRAGGTFLGALLPAAAHEGGTGALRSRLLDPATRAALRAAGGLFDLTEPGDVLLTGGPHTGRTLADVTGTGDAWETLCDLVLADPGTGMVVTLMAERDVRALMADPLVAIGSDNGVPVGLQHPRTWGCFPRFLGTYVRDLGVVDWPEAVRKCTSATADQFGLVGRGFLGPGAVADLAVFDPDAIGHGGSYAQPDVTPGGMRFVVLAGHVVIDDGTFTAERRGRVLRPA